MKRIKRDVVYYIDVIKTYCDGVEHERLLHWLNQYQSGTKLGSTPAILDQAKDMVETLNANGLSLLAEWLENVLPIRKIKLSSEPPTITLLDLFLSSEWIFNISHQTIRFKHRLYKLENSFEYKIDRIARNTSMCAEEIEVVNKHNQQHTILTYILDSDRLKQFRLERLT